MRRKQLGVAQCFSFFLGGEDGFEEESIINPKQGKSRKCNDNSRQNISTRGTLSKNFGAKTRINEEKLPKNYELERMRLNSLAEEVKLKKGTLSPNAICWEKLQTFRCGLDHFGPLRGSDPSFGLRGSDHSKSVRSDSERIRSCEY